MTVDYSKIRAENEVRYGTDIGRIGPMLLSDRYDNRAHFIYELLQNAEDAFSRRAGFSGPRSITFTLSQTGLRISHFGAPFTEPNVRGICGIAESTKDLTSIGRFGIGFKSVYAFTDRPEIHSAGEHFRIENFVWPIAIEPSEMHPEETVFILPISGNDVSAFADITEGLRRLGPRALLFLRHIEEIAWSVVGGASGLYLRSKPEAIGANARKIVVLGQGSQPKDSVEETWLVFSREVHTDRGVPAGFVEVAFALTKNEETGASSVVPIDDSTLIVFFPTVVPTHLGFLVQGPYRTTPSRDNIPRHDSWNQQLVRETAILLVEGLNSLRELGFLNTNALRSLPLDRTNFGEGQMFAPVFAAVREALASQSLLPTVGGGYSSAKKVKLARTQDLRDLVSPSQLAELFGESNETYWLTADITQDRTPALRQYLIRELNIIEVIPETILPKLTKAFLEKQSDAWILRLYELLHGQPALSRQGRLDDVPLVRLDNGGHVTAEKGGRPQAFLPGPIATDFPTVRRSVCGTKVARDFLTTLGLTEPDPVDDVIWNVLPKYVGQNKNLTEYESDIQRIVAAFATDSKGQRDKLVKALRETPFVRVVDTGDQSKWVAQPELVYIATQRLKDLFEGVPKVYVVDETYGCLRGEPIRDLLEACGATRYLQPVRIASRFDWQQLATMRMGVGSSGSNEVNDFTLRGLDQLLTKLPTLDPESAKKKVGLLWDALCDVVDRRGPTVFLGTYSWFYRTQRSQFFDASFVLKLNGASWVPDRDGAFQSPEFVMFEQTGWKGNPFLQSKIIFKPAIIETLAKEAGIDPGVLDLLKKLGVTSEIELKKRLGIKDDEAEQPENKPSPGNVDDALKSLLGDTAQPTPPISDPSGPEPAGVGSGRSSSGAGVGGGARVQTGGPAGGDSVGTDLGDRRQKESPGGGTGASGTTPGNGSGGDSGSKTTGSGGTGGVGTSGSPGDGRRTSSSTGGSRPFISYIGSHPDDEGPDPDGLDQPARLALEEKAIKKILAREPDLLRTQTNNPGFDLVATDGGGAHIKWIEVKAMTGTLRDRPVGLSRTQFDCARDHGSAYWLYVVEWAGDPNQVRIVRVQDPAGRARTFTFDQGWASIAEIDEDAVDNS
jgi:hypothetical protein